MNTNSEKPGWLFYSGWIVLNVIAVVIAAYLAWILVSLAEKIVGGRIQVAGQSHITEDFLLLYLLFPLIGLLTGLVQYILLRRYLPRLEWWVGATLLGWLLPFAVGSVFAAILSPGSETDTVWLMSGSALIGGSIGLPQWLLLRQKVTHAVWWLLAYGFAWAMMGSLNGITSEPFAVLSALAFMSAVTTGIACWLLLDWLPQREGAGRLPVH